MMTDLACPACHAAAPRRYHYGYGDILVCQSCRLQWAQKAVNDVTGADDITSVHDHYMDPSKLDAESYAPYCDFFAMLGGIAPGHLRILDVGCGNGMFVGECLRRGHDAWGVEIDVSKLALMAPDVRARVEIIAVEDLPTPPTPFDVIAFWDSFEHLRDPFAVLAQLRHCMAPHTVVFIRVNNTHDVFNLTTQLALRLIPVLGRRLLEVCFNLPQHYWNFSIRGMTLLLRQSGWEVVARRVTDTPAGRLTSNPAFRLAITGAYLINRTIRGGKIGEYYVRTAGKA